MQIKSPLEQSAHALGLVMMAVRALSVASPVVRWDRYLARETRIKPIVEEILRMMRIVALVFGNIAVLLGGLWLLQGLGVVRVRPILCFVDCVPIQGPSLTWAIVAAIALAIGGYCVVWSLKRPA